MVRRWREAAEESETQMVNIEAFIVHSLCIDTYFKIFNCLSYASKFYSTLNKYNLC